MSPEIEQSWNLASNIALVIGVPLAILSFLWEARRQRQNERLELQQKQEEIYQRLSDEYVEFIKLLLQYPELKLLRDTPLVEFSLDQQDQRHLIFGVLVALFERAFILVYEDKMDPETRRRWQSWEDYMREWCLREDFRRALSRHLEGEDEYFRRHISGILAEEGHALSRRSAAPA